MLSLIIWVFDWLEKWLEGFFPCCTSGMVSATSLVIFVLITTCIYSVRMTTLYNMYTARMNVYTYAKLAESERHKKKKKYEEIAKRWLKHANWWRKTHLRNCRKVRVCFGFDIIGFVVFLLELNRYRYWRVLLILSWVAFFGSFLKNYVIFGKDKPDKL
jgi:hypothetical protein